MTVEDRHGRMEAARIRSELTVQNLWLRYVALGGSGDAFDLDGYLQGLVSLESYQEDVLAQALNEELASLYEAHRIPMSWSAAVEDRHDDRLRDLVERLLAQRSTPRPDAETRDDEPA